MGDIEPARVVVGPMGDIARFGLEPALRRVGGVVEINGRLETLLNKARELGAHAVLTEVENLRAPWAPPADLLVIGVGQAYEVLIFAHGRRCILHNPSPEVLASLLGGKTLES